MTNSPIAPNLVKVTEIFLVPSSFLVAALGTADTNIHRAAVSLIGLVISVLWCVCSREAAAEQHAGGGEDEPNRPPLRTSILNWLPIIFVVGWFISTIGHAWFWNVPLR